MVKTETVIAVGPGVTAGSIDPGLKLQVEALGSPLQENGDLAQSWIGRVHVDNHVRGIAVHHINAARLRRHHDGRPKRDAVRSCVVGRIHVTTARNLGLVREVILNILGNIYRQGDYRIAAARGQSVCPRAGKRCQRAGPAGAADVGWNWRILHVRQSINYAHRAHSWPKAYIADCNCPHSAGLAACKRSAMGFGDG